MTRDLRLDLVRVIAIFGVVTLHVAGGSNLWFAKYRQSTSGRFFACNSKMLG